MILLPALRAISLSSRAISSFSTAAASAFLSGRTTAVALSPPPSVIGGQGGVIGGRRHGVCGRRNMSSSLSSSSSSSRDGGVRNLVVDPFCHRQFASESGEGNYAGAVFDIPILEFEDVVNSRYDPSRLVDGYAPFCKHLFVINDFTDARVSVLPIIADNERHLRTRYEARTEWELPVLTRHFDRESLLLDAAGGGSKDDEKRRDDDVFPVARYLDLILYSREQIEKENSAMGKAPSGEETKETAPWGIVSIKAQDVDRELPMTPITIMRNALGKDQGGSGVMLTREAYMESVSYWKDHANVL